MIDIIVLRAEKGGQPFCASSLFNQQTFSQPSALILFSTAIVLLDSGYTILFMQRRLNKY